MATEQLGKFADRFTGFRKMMAGANVEQRWTIFESAATEAAKCIGWGLNRAAAADELTDMAFNNGLDDPEEVQDVIAYAFENIPNGGDKTVKPNGGLVVWDAGDPFGEIPPRQWLLGTQFCRGFISSLVAAGGVGKTALRAIQFISMALGRSLCGQHVFHRSRVLILNFEDDENEMKRRIKAVLDFYRIDQAELKGWLLCSSPPKRSKLAFLDKRNRRIGPLVQQISSAIEQYRPDLISLDPFVKTHSLEENDSGDMDFVCELLAEMASNYNVAADAPHHVHKGIIVPGDADSGRGSSGIKDAARLVYTLCPMSEDEAQQFGIGSKDRHSYVRLDPAKINIAIHSSQATWFRLHSQHIGNKTDTYPNGDTVQVVEPWAPPDTWAGTSSEGLNAILDSIEKGADNGQRYSNAPAAAPDRQVWQLVQRKYPDKGEGACREIIHAWLTSGLLYVGEYHDPVQRAKRKGLFVNGVKRPG